MIVAIDGPAGAGKTTAARNLARRLGYLYLDTGATFRAVAWKALQKGVSLDDPQALERIAKQAEIGFSGDADQRVILDGEDVTTAIRAQEVTDASSQIAVYPEVRRPLMELWRAIGKDGGVVLEGRDIGTVVFPDAELKFFLVADPSTRAARRYRERAGEPGVTPEQVGRELARRDEVDRARRHAPMVKAPDAIRVDTSGLSPAETLDWLEREARARMGAGQDPL
jgi:cytidylate kinase